MKKQIREKRNEFAISRGYSDWEDMMGQSSDYADELNLEFVEYFISQSQDWSKSCTCEEGVSKGETWCCNHCGLPTNKQSQGLGDARGIVFNSIRNSKVKRSARTRQCFDCLNNIKKGEKYVSHEFRYDKTIITAHFHKKCYSTHHPPQVTAERVKEVLEKFEDNEIVDYQGGTLLCITPNKYEQIATELTQEK